MMRLRILLLLPLMLGSHLFAAPVELFILPTDLQGWANVNDRDDSDANITINQPRSGDGSLQLSTIFVTAGQDKTDYQISWEPSSFPNRTISTLSKLSFDYYRDSAGSTVASHFHPVIRLAWYNDAGTPLVIADDTKGFLIYEEIYQGITSVIEDSWVSKSIDFNADNFWMYCSPCAGGVGVVTHFSHTLQDWKAGPPAHVLNPTNFTVGTTYIFAVNTGIGSGWNGDVLMWADNIRLAFDVDDDFIYNFEVSARSNASNAVSVPLFTNLGVLIMLLSLVSAGLYLERRKVA